VSPPPATVTVTDPRIAEDLRSFDVMWQRVNDRYYDPAHGGVPWAAVGAELRPQILATKTRAESRAIMNAALARLGKSHFGVSGPLTAPGGSPGAAGDATIGADVRIVGGAAIVARLTRGAPAERAGLRLGAELVSIDGDPIAPLLAEVARELPGAPAAAHVAYRQARAVQHRLAGAPGSAAALVVRVPPAPAAALEVPRVELGSRVSFGNTGPLRLEYEAREIAPRVGYLRLSMFFDPATVMPRFADDLARFAGATGLIVDLRGNPGGLPGMAMGMAGSLVAESNRKLGTMRTRETTFDYVISSQPVIFRGKVAILVDELSGSAAEIFAGGLQDLGRARVVGRRTAGAALPSVLEILPNGDRLQYAIADYTSAGGRSIEGHGVSPDLPVPWDLSALRRGVDPDVAAALTWIQEK
jgi:carboxyl-terminal processing protease